LFSAKGVKAKTVSILLIVMSEFIPPHTPENGRTGLANLGNTCFMNSCVQVLNHTYELIYLKTRYSPHIKRNVPGTVVLLEYEELRDVMFSNNGIVSPNKFVAQIRKYAHDTGHSLFTEWAQNDMSEFLLLMITAMHQSISRGVNAVVSGSAANPTDELAKKCYDTLSQTYAKEYSEIMELFYGIYVSEIWRIDGSIRHSVKPELFCLLDVPIPAGIQNATIYDCLDLFTTPESLVGDNAWLNENTKTYEDIQKRTAFWSFPRVLILILKRFSPDGTHKNQDFIRFPLETLDLSKYVSGYNPQSFVYDLFGVCNHDGDVNRGHYNAFAKRHTGEWMYFDDTTVQKVDNPAFVVSPMAYCLFYRKKNG
jgi:ubiquitin C-terminal hydrolase